MDLSLSKETNDNTDVFTEEVESPRCGSILYAISKFWTQKLMKIYKLSSSTKDAHIKSARQLKDVSESIKLINEKFEEDKVGQKQKEKEIVKLKEDLVSLKE